MREKLKNIDKPLLILATLLFAFGLIMIFSASNVTAFMKYKASPYQYFMKQSIFLIISVVLGYILLHFHTKTYRWFSTLGMAAVIGLLLLLRVYGSMKNKAISWIDFGFFSIQPSEFAKLISIVWLATYYEHNKEKLSNYVTSLFPLVICFMIALLIFAQPDLGTMIIYSSIIALIFFIVPIDKEIRRKIIGILVCLVLIVAIVFVSNGHSLLKTGQNKRLDFTNPCSSEKFYGTGNQVCNGYIAINHGGLTGVGLGNSTQKYLYLPEAHTDFIFCIIMEETGLIGAIAVLGLYFFLIGRIIKIGKESHTDRGATICFGIAMYILVHIIVNLGGIFGLMPMTGVPLPFMSYGGSFTMTLVLALTIVQRVNIETKMFAEKQLKISKKEK